MCIWMGGISEKIYGIGNRFWHERIEIHRLFIGNQISISLVAEKFERYYHSKKVPIEMPGIQCIILMIIIVWKTKKFFPTFGLAPRSRESKNKLNLTAIAHNTRTFTLIDFVSVAFIVCSSLFRMYNRCSVWNTKEQILILYFPWKIFENDNTSEIKLHD